MTEAAADELKGLRVEIDRLDAAMHALLIERGQIIDKLIDIKRRQGRLILERIIGIVDVGLVVLGQMDFHRARINVRLQGVVGVA